MTLVKLEMLIHQTFYVREIRVLLKEPNVFQLFLSSRCTKHNRQCVCSLQVEADLERDNKATEWSSKMLKEHLYTRQIKSFDPN